VYSGDRESPGIVPEIGGSTESNFMTVLAKNGEPVVPENLYGEVRWFDIRFTYKGVKRIREKRGNDKTPWKESCWEVIGDNDTENPEYDYEVVFDNEGNAIIVSQAVDDNGNPFLLFDWSTPYAGHGTMWGYYVGKKIVKGQKRGQWLSEEEMERLGMDLSFKQVERLAKEGSIGSDTGDSGNDSEENSGSDDKEHETGELDPRKRKAPDSESGTAGKRAKA
jgi:hypothetical protein